MLRIKEIAEEQGLNITGLANKAGMAYSQVHELWSGKTRRPALSSLQKVADALHVPVGVLFADTPYLPGDLHGEVVRSAEEDERSFNAQVIKLLREALAARKRREPPAQQL